MLTPQVRMDGSDGVWPGSDWWCGLVAILFGPGRRDGHFGHPGSHMWGWWCISRAYPRLDCAVVACANGWDMMRWHNPSNRDAAAIVVDHVAAWAAAEPAAREERDWRWKRSYLAGAILAERTRGSLGIDAPLHPGLAAGALGDVDPAGLAAGLRDVAALPMDRDGAARTLTAGPAAPPPEQVDALLQDLGMAYGLPLPLWFWD
jgi:hypothetical protein